MLDPGHYNFELKDRLFDVTNAISSEMQGRVLPGWKRKEVTAGRQYYGSVHVLQAARMQIPGQVQEIIPPVDLPVYAPHDVWVGSQMGFGAEHPVRLKVSGEDENEILKLCGWRGENDEQHSDKTIAMMLLRDRKVVVSSTQVNHTTLLQATCARSQ